MKQREIIHATTLEAIECREALSLVEDLNLQHLHIASDCAEVVNGIRINSGGAFRGIIRELKQRETPFISCNLVHEFRGTNHEPHKIARLGTTFPQGRHICLGSLHDALVILVNVDMS